MLMLRRLSLQGWRVLDIVGGPFITKRLQQEFSNFDSSESTEPDNIYSIYTDLSITECVQPLP